MSLLRRLILAFVLMAGTAPAFAQAPLPVPALPDTERRTTFTLSASPCACAVGFALYGDGTDYQNWVEVFVNGVRVNYNDGTYGWTITSPTGALGFISRPVTDAVLTFTNAQTGTVQVVGARRPRRSVVFQENRGVAARDLNQGINDITAVLRELWDKTNDVTGRALLGLPGESIAAMPSASARAGLFMCWDGTGLIPSVCAPLSGTGNVAGPGSSVNGHFAVFNGTTGKLLADGGAPAPSATIDTTNGANISSGTLPNARISALPNVNLATMPGLTIKGNNTGSGATPADLTVAQVKAMLGPGIVSVTDAAYGAKGDGVTDDTAAFQSAITAACGASGFGKLRVPATANSYLVTKINHTNCNNVIIEGDGDQSLIKINGSDANGNWWDLSGSNNIQFRNLRFIDNGSPVTIAFLWACTGTSCGTSGVLSGLSFDHVNINAKVGRAVLFGYGYGCAANCATNISGASLSITNSSWKNTYNQSVTGEQTRNAVLSLSAYNAGSFRSVYQTITTSTAIAARTHLYNADIIDQATAGSTLSNNAAAVVDGVNQMVVIGGSFQCQCDADFIGWTSTEGLTFIMTAFQSPVPGSGCVVNKWVEFGGGINSVIAFVTPFWSCPSGATGSAFIALDAGVSASNGGIQYLTVKGNDVGLNTNNAPFIGKTVNGCGSFAAANQWIVVSDIQLLAGANKIATCGSIDSKTIIQNAGTITLVSGATDAGSSNPFR